MSNGRDFNFDIEIDRLLTPYIQGEADRELELEKIKDKILEKDRDTLLSFKVKRKQLKTMYIDANNQIKVEFPSAYGDVNKVVVNHEGDDTIIIFKGIKLDLK
ncbi:hypothetical protein D3C81_1687200 [compost metagenome]